jgi:hypothetical protein
MAGKAFPVPADAATQDLAHARALNDCQHRPLSESGHPDRPVLAKLTYGEMTFNGEPTFNGPHIELAMTANEQLADRLKNGSPVQDADELGIPCVINTVNGRCRLRTGDRVTVDGGPGYGCTYGSRRRAISRAEAASRPKPRSIISAPRDSVFGPGGMRPAKIARMAASAAPVIEVSARSRSSIANRPDFRPRDRVSMAQGVTASSKIALTRSSSTRTRASSGSSRLNRRKRR